MKISGMERKSSGKRDSFFIQPKDTKENMKPPAKVCFSKVYFIELLKLKYGRLSTYNFLIRRKSY